MSVDRLPHIMDELLANVLYQILGVTHVRVDKHSAAAAHDVNCSRQFVELVRQLTANPSIQMWRSYDR